MNKVLLVSIVVFLVYLFTMTYISLDILNTINQIIDV